MRKTVRIASGVGNAGKRDTHGTHTAGHTSDDSRVLTASHTTPIPHATRH
jgi:hypothetical protein